MYNYDFKNEKVNYEKTNCFIDVDNKSYVFSMLITDENILLFDNINKNNILNGRGGYLPAENDLVLKIPINNLKYKVENNNTIINFNNKMIIIYDFRFSSDSNRD